MVETLPEITIMGQIPPNLSKAGKAFTTADEAAIAALDEILAVSITNDFEYSGAIYKLKATGKFAFTYAETEESSNSSNANPAIPTGSAMVGVYHTHGASEGKKNAENFSPDDIMLAIASKRISWLGTPTKRIKKLIPPALLTGSDKQKYGIFGKQIIVR